MLLTQKRAALQKQCKVIGVVDDVVVLLIAVNKKNGIIF